MGIMWCDSYRPLEIWYNILKPQKFMEVWMVGSDDLNLFHFRVNGLVSSIFIFQSWDTTVVPQGEELL